MKMFAGLGTVRPRSRPVSHPLLGGQIVTLRNILHMHLSLEGVRIYTKNCGTQRALGVTALLFVGVLEKRFWTGSACVHEMASTRATHCNDWVGIRSLLSVPLTFLATSRYRASSMCFVRLGAILIPLLFSGIFALLFLIRL